MGEIQVDLEKSNRRMLARIVQELEAKQVWQAPPALLWTCGSGQLRGRAQLVGCRQLNRRKFMKYQHKHQVPNAEMVTYKNIWAWILKDAEPYENSFHYSHTQGAVIFVKVRKPMGPGNRGTANASTKKRKATAAAGKRQSRGLTATSVEPPTGPEDCQNCTVPRNQHCGSREAPNEKKNEPAKEQWKFVVDPTSEPSWSDVALYEKDLHRKNARSIMTPQPNMSMTSEASTMRWKMPRRDEATAVRKDSVRFLAAPGVSYFGQYKWKPHEIIHIFMKVKNRHTT